MEKLKGKMSGIKLEELNGGKLVELITIDVSNQYQSNNIKEQEIMFSNFIEQFYKNDKIFLVSEKNEGIVIRGIKYKTFKFTKIIEN